MTTIAAWLNWRAMKTRRGELAGEHAPHERTYRLAELCEMFGFTARQLRDFRAKGALQHPEGVGRGAYYTEEHVHRLRAIRPLFNAGISVARIADRYRATDINAQLLEPPNEIQAPGQWQQARVGTGLHLAVLVDSTLEHSCDELLSHLVDEARKFLARRVSPGYRHETPG